LSPSGVASPSTFGMWPSARVLECLVEVSLSMSPNARVVRNASLVRIEDEVNGHMRPILEIAWIPTYCH